MHASGKSARQQNCFKNSHFSALTGKTSPNSLPFFRLFTFFAQPQLSYAAEFSASWQHWSEPEKGRHSADADCMPATGPMKAYITNQPYLACSGSVPKISVHLYNRLASCSEVKLQQCRTVGTNGIAMKIVFVWCRNKLVLAEFRLKSESSEM